MKRKLIYSFLLFLLLADLGYSFAQHLSQPLDGDMAWNIVPADEVKPILENPLGFDVIFKNQVYPNPNRFFCHFAMKQYFDTAPAFLQRFVSPVDSVYLSCAIVKIIIQLLLILLLSTAITGTLNLKKTDFLIAAVLVTPFFQTEGYQSYMGIIDRCTTYTFFYALPATFLLFYFLPLFTQYYHKKSLFPQALITVLWIPLALVICLSGPLNTGVVLICTLLIFAEIIYRNYTMRSQPGVFKKIRDLISGIPKNYWFYLLPVSLFALYSLYIGRYNSNNVNIPLTELYSRLPAGLFYPAIKKLGIPVLTGIIALNLIIIWKKFKTAEGRKIVTLSKWTAVFMLLYVLLLPLGGYRDYRPNVLRYDTMIPVNLALIFMFGISAYFLLKNLTRKQNIWYIPVIVGVLLLFTINDESHFEKNKNERAALNEISLSKSDTVRIPAEIQVLSWLPIQKPEHSYLNSQLLTIWKITKTNKLYYNAE